MRVKIWLLWVVVLNAMKNVARILDVVSSNMHFRI